MAPDENYILKAESDFLVISIERKLFHLIPLLVDVFAILFFRRVHLIQHHINNKRFDYLIVLVIEFFQDDKRVFVIFNCS